MIIRILPISILATLMICGCQKPSTDTTPDLTAIYKDTPANIVEPRQDSDKSITKPRAQMSEIQTEREETDKRAFRILTEAGGSYAKVRTAKAWFEAETAEDQGGYEY